MVPEEPAVPTGISPETAIETVLLDQEDDNTSLTLSTYATYEIESDEFTLYANLQLSFTSNKSSL